MAVSLRNSKGQSLRAYLGSSVTVRIGFGHDKDDGTPFAAAHVSGVAALLWSNCPACSNVEIRDALAETAEDLGSSGRDDSFGDGLVRARNALNYLRTTSCCDSTSSSDNPTQLFGGKSGYLCVPNDDGGRVTVEAFGDYKWFLHHGALKNECLLASQPVNNGKALMTFCRIINDKYDELQAPRTIRRWLEKQRWRRGTCDRVYGE